MDHVQYAFQCTSSDDASATGQIRAYTILFFHGNNTRPNEIEIICDWNNKRYLKKSKTSLGINDLFVGGRITVHRVRFNIKDAADTFTASFLKQNQQKALMLIKPTAMRNLGHIIGVIEEAGDIVLTRLTTCRLDSENAKLWTSMTQEGDSLDEKILSEGACVALDLRGVNACARARELVSSISSAKVGVHISSSAGNAQKEAAFFFDSDNIQGSETGGANCSVCLVKPHAVRSGCAGAIIQTIAGSGMEITACEKLTLSTSEAAVFLRSYDFLRNFAKHKAELSSGPLFALEVRGTGVLQRLRKLAGPHDVAVARVLRPDTLRAKFGVNSVLNAVHVTDLESDGPIESRFFFGAA